MIRKTKNYEMFKFREDNRAAINIAHVDRLAKCIKSRNLLEWRPIMVNSDMEIVDGQHRLKAAEKLGVDIYYEVREKFVPDDIISMNMSKSWGSMDYLNFYCVNNYEEYLKLKNFMDRHDLTLKIAINLTGGDSKTARHNFKVGKYSYNPDQFDQDITICRETINYIKKQNGYSAWTDSTRFWASLVKMIKNPNFRLDKWMHNLERMISKVGPRARTEDYMRLITEIYNWKNEKKIFLFGLEKLDT